MARLSASARLKLLKEIHSPLIDSATSQLPEHLRSRYQRLLLAIQRQNTSQIMADVKWFRNLLGARSFIFDLALPVFAWLASVVQSNRLDIAGEHAFSAIMRNEIGDIMHTLAALPAPSKGRIRPILFGCPEGDMHEFGILMAATLAASYSLPIFYAGSNLPAASLVSTTQSLGSELIILGNAPVPVGQRPVSFGQFLTDIDAGLNKDAAIWVGGQGDRPFTSLNSRREFKYINDLRELDALLLRRVNRVQ
jgi:hypothetical protein